VHVCSGTVADYTVTLPAAATVANQTITFRMAGALTKLVTLAGNGGETIDGAATRVMWAHESATLWSDGTSWAKIGGRSVPMAATLKRTTAQSVPVDAWTAIACTTVVSDNTPFAFADSVNGRVNVKRPGRYAAAGFVSFQGVTTGEEVNGGVAKSAATPSDGPNAFTTTAAPASNTVQASASATFDCVAGDWLSAIGFQSDSVARDTRTAATVLPTLSVTEIVSW
jgi:hypothetical protein